MKVGATQLRDLFNLSRHAIRYGIYSLQFSVGTRTYVTNLTPDATLLGIFGAFVHEMVGQNQGQSNFDAIAISVLQ